jgi:hypothetical protein
MLKRIQKIGLILLFMLSAKQKDADEKGSALVCA